MKQGTVPASQQYLLIDLLVLQCYTLLVITVKNLMWDDFNIRHIVRHDVSRDEVKAACLSEHVALQTYGGRILLIGVTESGRVISVVLSPKGEDSYYPVTARDASRKERSYYDQIKGGEKAS